MSASPSSHSMKDFDRMFAELHCRRIPFTILGEVHSIPSEVPALLVLELARRADGESLDARLIMKAARQIFGEELIERLCAQPDFSLRRLEMMLSWALSAINGEAAPAAPDEKN